MKRNKNKVFTIMAAGLSLFLMACGANNGDLPKEDNYQNTTESAPESTDNLTGYGDITDSTATDSPMQGAGSTSGTTSGTTTGTTTSGTTGGGTTGGGTTGG